MPGVFIINAHQPYPFSQGGLNRALADLAADWLVERGFEVRSTDMPGGYDVTQELENHRWADLVLLQSPVNWMGVPWSFKKYMDEVYTAGMDGQLCDGDGRSRQDSGRHYGSAGTLTGKRYMLSLTFNAPAEAFGDETQYLFQGRDIDDLFLPMHMNFRFFGMQPLPTFACMDVLKNPQIEADFERYRAHLDTHVDLLIRQPAEV